MTDEIPLRDVAVVAGRQEKVFAAFALVGTHDAHVGDVTEPEVIDHAQGLFRRLYYERASGLEVQEHGPVGGLRVGGQEVAPRVGARLGVTNLVWFGQPDAAEPIAHRNQRSAGNGVEEDLDPTQEVKCIVEIGGRGRRRYPINEVEPAEWCFQRPRHAECCHRLRQLLRGRLLRAIIRHLSPHFCARCPIRRARSGTRGHSPDCLFEDLLRQVRKRRAAVAPGSPDMRRVRPGPAASFGDTTASSSLAE